VVIISAAVDVARSRFPDIEFDQVDVNNIESMRGYLRSREKVWGKEPDLVFSSECLSYIENWKNLVQEVPDQLFPA